MIIYSKSFYKHYNEKFDNNNKLYEYSRNYKYQKLFKFIDINIDIKKGEITYNIFTFVIKITSIIAILITKTFLLTALFILLLSLLYRIISPLLSIYETAILKIYFIINDLYIKYAPLKYVKLLYFIIIFFTITRYIRFMVIFFIIIIKNLYKRFYKKLVK